MQDWPTPGYGHSYDLRELMLLKSESMLIRSAQYRRGIEACYRTEKRFSCADDACEWRSNCRKLVAVWKR